MYNFAYSYFQIINIILSDFILQLHFFNKSKTKVVLWLIGLLKFNKIKL